MKKIIVFALMIALACVFSASSAFAWSENSDGATIICGSTAGETHTISLSPKVVAGYTVANNTGVNDWYVVGTYHNGGTKVFATASSITKIWNDEAAAGEALSDLFADAPQTPANAGSDDVWSDAGWSAL